MRQICRRKNRLQFSPAPVTAAPVAVPALTKSTWTGPYVGLEAGYLSGNSQTGTVCNNNDYLCLSGTSYDGDLKQGNLGGYAGYNYQMEKFVIGAEVSVNAGLGKGVANFSGPIDMVGSLYTGSSYNADIRARFGYLMTNDVLVFATGGIGFSDFKIDDAGTCNNCSQWGSANVDGGDRVGYVIGGGLEYAISQTLHLKAEYLHSDYGSKSTNYSYLTNTIALDTKYASDQVRVGLSYNF
jgi:outer membrane immunogenic protein